MCPLGSVAGRDVGVRLWVSNLDGSGSRLVSEGTTGPRDMENNGCVMPVEQKAPAWSADSQHIAVLEGIEEVYMSPFTHMSSDPRVRFATRSRDQLLTSTWYAKLQPSREPSASLCLLLCHLHNSLHSFRENM